MNKADLKVLIESNQELFLKKLKYAGLNELEYWEKRPENLSRELLVKYLNSIDEAILFIQKCPQEKAAQENMARLALPGYLN